MASLQVRDLPEHIFRKLSAAAEREHRSLTQQAIAVLEKGLGIERAAKNRRVEAINQLLLSPLIQADKKLKNPTSLIREDRNR